MGSDFVTDIKNTEKKAQDMIAKAHHAGAQKKVKEREKLEKQLQTQLEEDRNQAKQKIVAKQTEMRSLYTDLVKEGEREADKIRKDAETKKEKVLSGAFLYFMNELI